MKYDALSSTTVKIILSEDDMREYSLCTEGIALHTLDAKEKLTRLLSEMKLFKGYKAERLFLEVFPRNEGGCILYVSALGEPTLAEESAAVCTVGELDTLIRLCKELYSLSESVKTKVYKKGSDYILTVAADDIISEPIKRILSEYGRLSFSLTEIYSVAEYGVCICGERAIEIFSKLY